MITKKCYQKYSQAGHPIVTSDQFDIATNFQVELQNSIENLRYSM